MAAAIRHTRSICAAEALVQATFDDIIPAGDDWCERTVNLQKEFKAVVRLARRQFESLKADINHWQRRVRSGEIDFTPAQEDDFKGALRACIDLAGLLSQKFDTFRMKGLFLANPRVIGLLESHKKEAENILDSWRPPEWEVTGMRAVKWDREQTEYLLAKLGSCE